MTILSETVSADVPHKGEQHFFELRQQLKESIRKKMREESGFFWNISQESKKLPSDNYGSFFGQSQPSIALRVIKENKFMVEAKQSVTEFKNSSTSKADVVMQKVKAQQLRASRDYSFIFSDDYDNLTSLSSTIGKATQQHPSSWVQGAMSNSLQKKHLEEGKEKDEPKKSQLISKIPGEHKNFLSNKSMKQCKKLLEPCIEKVGSKQMKSIERLISEDKIKVVKHKKAKVNENKLQCSSKSQAFDVDKVRHKKQLNEPSRLESFSQNKNLNGSSKPSLIIRLKIPSKLKMAKEMEVCKPKNEESISSQKRSYKMHEHRKEPEDSHCHDSEIGKDYISSLCQSFSRRNLKKRVRDDYEESDDCMVASFADIQREERQSAKIARREDRIEQLRNEQEEKERLRRQAKKHKILHN